MNLPSFIAGVLIGIIATGVFVLTLIAHKMPAVTKHRRGGYQPLPATRMPPPPMPRVKPAREEVAIAEAGGVNYAFINLTGMEDK